MTTAVGQMVKTKVGKKLDEHDELAKFRQQQQDEQHNKDMIKVVLEGLQPINKSLEEISGAIVNNTRGTVTLLREDMRRSHDNLVAKKFATAAEVASWHELYNTYAQLGGNHFKEYVDAWKDDIEALPRSLPKSKSKTKNKQ